MIHACLFDAPQAPLPQLLSHQFAVPHVNIAVLEHFLKSLMKPCFLHSLFQHYLQKPAAPGAADHTAVDQVRNTFKNLVDENVGASLVNLFRQLPVLTKELCKIVHMAPAEFKGHQGRHLLYLV